MMRAWLRRLLRVRPPFITADLAVATAREEVRRRGLTDRPEVDVREGVRVYHVHFGPFEVKPGGPWVTVDLVTGQVRSFTHYKR